MAYSKDLKERVLAYIRQGGGKAEAARLFSVGRSTVFVWLSQPSDHIPGVPGPKTSRCIDRNQLMQLVAEHPDWMIDELAAKLLAKRSTVHRNLQVLGLVRKKNTALRPRGASGRM
jgi:transposase-like protein